MLFRRAFLISLFILSACCNAESLRVEFQPQTKGEAIRGNLIVLSSERKFHPEYPGLLDVYMSTLVVKEALTLKAGDSVELEVPKDFVSPKKHLAVYFDENHNFMWRGIPDAGEYFSDRVQGQSELSLEHKKRPRKKRNLPWLTEHAILSPLLLDAGFTREQSTVKFLVGLPPGYWSSNETYPVTFVSHGFNGDRWTYLKNYKRWRKQMEEQPMLLVSLDSYGPFGHHLFLNSEANGPRLDVLTQEIVPEIDRLYRTNGKRVIYGQSSGGWTAISVLRRAPNVFAGAIATGPDPLTLPSWWMDEAENFYRNSDGSERSFAPSIGLTMKRFVDAEIKTQSYGQFAAFLACFSPHRPSLTPFPFDSPFDLESGKLKPAIWDIWKENDLELWLRQNPEKAKETFSGRLVLFVGTKDEFGLYETSKRFHETLSSLEIPHDYREVKGAGHTNYLERPEFAKELWSALFELQKTASPTP